MASATTRIVAPGVSARFVVDDRGCRLHSLGESGGYDERPLLIPPELSSRTWATCDEAAEYVRGFFASR